MFVPVDSVFARARFPPTSLRLGLYSFSEELDLELSEARNRLKAHSCSKHHL